MEEQLQYLSLLTDYNDRAFEIEMEAEANALRIKRQMIAKECAAISQAYQEKWKSIEQNCAVLKSQYISDARRRLMDETKGVFEALQREAEQQIAARVAADRPSYLAFLDELIMDGATHLGGKVVVAVNENDRDHVQQSIARYQEQTGVQIHLGKGLALNELGAKVYSEDLKICVNSTIQQRLRQAMRVKAPELNAIVLPDVPLIE